MNTPERPIISEEGFREALTYIAAQAQQLATVVTGETLALDTVTIFTRSDQEFDFLEPLVRRYGDESKYSHGLTLYIDSDFELAGNHIKFLGIRRPDDSRREAGYGDYPVTSLDVWRARLKDNEFAKFVQSGRGQDLIELKHPDFDVRGYLVLASEH